MVYQWPFDADDEHAVALAASAQEARPRFRGVTLPAGLQQLLEASLGVRLVLPDHSGYARARRVFNPAFDPFPSGIAFCNSENGVALCLQGVRAHNFPFRVRASGHSFAGYSSADDVLVIDVSALNSIQIDRGQRLVTVGAGCKLKPLQDSLTAQALQLPLGNGIIAVGGFMQGAGYGSTARADGMNADNVLEVRIMLGDGQIVTASETKNHDLWWAVRGATGGNFGVLLTVTYRAHARVAPSSRTLWWRLGQNAGRANAAGAIMNLQSILATAPSEFMGQADIRYWPDDPNDLSRSPWLMIAASLLGSERDLDALLHPMLGSGEMKFTGFPPRRLDPFVRHARFVSGLQLEHWRSLVDDFLDNSNLYSTLTMDCMGGAINSYPLEKSAFVHRDSTFNAYVTGFWIKGDRQDEQKVETYLRGWSKLIAPFWNNHVFQNFPYQDVPDYRANYWGAAFPSLLAVKEKYDLTRLFTFPQAIEPGLADPGPPTWPPQVVQWLKKPIEY
jgi:hypothetical protein